MLLTITTTLRPATDLGYLLHKHPGRVQEFGQSFGTARVFYPEADGDRCTAALLLLEVDPVRLARSRGSSSPDFSLSQYVNDRPYAASSLPAAVAMLETAAERGLDVGALLDRTRRRAHNAALFRDAYARYCWPVSGLDGVRLAPFQILACEGRATAVDEPHEWHLETLGLIDSPLVRRRFTGRKRSLALREHALGLEAPARLAEGEPLWRIYEAVFAVIALESEPVDPRL
ncbi:hypothetical protein [Microbispora sp. NBC_01389]|uniref:hypothetical protein n=1 Tax=Microbispora sp. NBC_01389 TaxID=2903584 RepID=UPI0032497A4A